MRLNPRRTVPSSPSADLVAKFLFLSCSFIFVSSQELTSPASTLNNSLVNPKNGRVVTSPKNTLNYSLEYPENGRANVILGSLFPIHSSSSTGDCGPIKGEDGIMALEALMFTLDKINNDKKLLPGIELGVLALDSCDSPAIALQQSLRFIKGFIASENRHHESEFKCKDSSEPVYEGGKYDKVVGVIGGQHSAVSVQMANVLRLFEVPQISYRSTSSSLSDVDRYPYFLRTVPADNNQAEVIFKVLEYLNISYASLVYSNTEYGNGGFNELLKKVKNSSVCFASPAFAVRPEDSQEVYQNIVDSLIKREKTKAIVMFADSDTAMKLLKVMQNSTTKKFLWIGSDAWTAHSSKLKEFSDVIEGSIGIQPLARRLPGFKKYFTNLTPDSNKRNPWFREYWEDHFNCSFEDDERGCDTFSLKNDTNFVNVKWLHFIRDAAYAFAYGLHNMWKKLCNEQPGLCQAIDHIHGDTLYQYLRDITFQDIANQTFRFQESGDGIPRYTVFTFRSPSTQERSPWVPIANFSYRDRFPDFNFISEKNFPYIPESFCGKPCGSNQAKISEIDECCWQCKNCTRHQYLNKSKNFCEECPVCKKPDERGVTCIEKEEKYLDYENQWAITSMAFAGLGIFSTILVGVIFWKHLDTPVIKAASRELSYILLGGIFLSFFMTFVILAPPSNVTCGFTRFFLGFSYTICYSAILTKTNRISRIFNKNPSKPQKAKYTSPTSQMVIVLLLVSVEVIINVSWLMYYKPEVTLLCQTENDYNSLTCKGINDFSYVVGFLYPFSLICLCTIYAIKTRKCPYGFNEAHYIAFTNYTTCILWLIFIPLYLTTSAKEEVRLVSLAMSLSLGAFVQLGCLFFPKVHIVLFKPERNTRDSVMCQPKSSSVGQQNSIVRHPHSAPAIVSGKNGDLSTYPGGTSIPSKTLGGPPTNTRSKNSVRVEKSNVNPAHLSVPIPIIVSRSD